jgi:hypothetical protein
MCGAKELTIIPQFAVGDTIRYRATTSLVVYHENDSLVSTTKMLPTLIVDEKNDKGFVITTINRLEDFSVECSDPEAGETLNSFDETDILNDFIAAIVLRIQLGADYRPDTILNMEEVKKSVLNAYVKMLEREFGTEVDVNEAPVVIGAISNICNQTHLIEQQFGNLPYFNFTGTPLKSGKIPASMIITGDLLKMCNGLNELDMDITLLESDMESGTQADDGLYSIKISGKKDNIEIEGLLLYGAGIMNHGILNLRTGSGSERLLTTYVIDAIK